MCPKYSTVITPRVKDIAGQRFGKLLVISFSHVDKDRSAVWNCVCDCGTNCQVIGKNLRKGITRSCGCWRNELIGSANSTHCLSNSPTWYTYRGMIARCCNPEHDSYSHYGARGIVVCDRWQESIENFVADMGVRPPGKTLDRIDLNGPYSPDNCRWATSIEQMNNRTNSHYITYQDQTLTIAQWSRIVNLPYGIITKRLERGWTAEQALTEQPNPNRKIKRRHNT